MLDCSSGVDWTVGGIATEVASATVDEEMVLVVGCRIGEAGRV